VSRLVAVVAVAVALFSTSCMQERAIAPAVDSRPETSTSTSTSLSSTTVPNSSSTQLPGSTTTLAPGTTTTTTRPPQVVTVTTNVDLGLPFAEEPATTERRDGAVRTFIDYERIPPFSTILVQNLGDETIPAVTVVDLIETSPTKFPAHPDQPPTTVRPVDITARPSRGSCQRRLASTSVEFTCALGELRAGSSARLSSGSPGRCR
jgi:hypothetical protein